MSSPFIHRINHGLEARENIEQSWQLLLYTLPHVVLAGLVEFMLYGIHIVLFLVCVHFMLLNRRTTHKIVFGALVLLFISSTVDVAFTARAVVHFIRLAIENKNLDNFLTPLWPKDTIFITNNFVADLLLLYRCYMVWGEKSKYWVVLGAVGIIAETVCGYIGIGRAFETISNAHDISILTYTYLGSVFVTNVALTGVTAGRIWWLARATKTFVEERHTKMYCATVAILLESGSIYPLGIIVFTVLIFSLPVGADYSLTAMLMRLVGITPTLMVVQVGLNRFTTEKSETTVHPSSSTHISSSWRSDIQGSSAEPGTARV